MKSIASDRLLHGADYNYDQWLGNKAILDKDLAYMKKAACNVMTIGIFAWNALEPAEGCYDFGWLDELIERLWQNDISVILATPSGSKPAWLSQRYPEVCRMTVDGRRENHGYRHNHCRSSPVYREACVQINRQLAERYGQHPALILWHVSNEYNGMPCYCPHCLSAFRAWLSRRYGSLDSLNQAWWTSFWSHRFSDWDQIFPNDHSINGLMLDWQRFTSDQTIDFFRAESAPLRAISPTVPITTNFMIPDVGLDYWAFAAELDIISWDSYPRWHLSLDERPEAVRTAFFHDLHRSYKGRSFLLMESTPSATNWQGLSKPKLPGMHRLASLQAIAHGSDSVQYFQWRQSRGGEEKFHSAVIGHLGSDDTRVFKDVAELGTVLTALGTLVASETPAEVALVYDYQNAWALSAAQMPRNIDKRYQEDCIEHYAAFWRRAVAVDLIDGSVRDLSKYKLVLLPMLYLFRNGFPEALKSYVEGGGTVVATYLTGLVDESDRCFLGGTPGGLSQLFGLVVEATDTVMDYENQSFSYLGKHHTVRHYADFIRLGSAQVQASFSEAPLAGLAAITSNRCGRGSAWYLAARTDSVFLDDFYGQLCSSLGIKACYAGPIPEGVSFNRRISQGKDYLFILNFNRSPVRLDFKTDGYVNALNGVVIDQDLAIPGFGSLVLCRTAPEAKAELC